MTTLNQALQHIDRHLARRSPLDLTLVRGAIVEAVDTFGEAQDENRTRAFPGYELVDYVRNHLFGEPGYAGSGRACAALLLVYSLKPGLPTRHGEALTNLYKLGMRSRGNEVADERSNMEVRINQARHYLRDRGFPDPFVRVHAKGVQLTPSWQEKIDNLVQRYRDDALASQPEGRRALRERLLTELLEINQGTSTDKLVKLITLKLSEYGFLSYV